MSGLPRSVTGRFGVAVIGLIVVSGIVRFWFHDALPYLVSYTEETYSRYWPERHVLLLHIVGGTLALLAGPFQLWSGLRRRFPAVHRRTGYVYISAIALAATSSFYLAFFTIPDFGLALFILAVVWLVTITMALVAIRNRRIDAHSEWMIRSYIVTFAFVSYRYLVGLSVFKALGSGRQATVLWISWVLPMLLFEIVSQWQRVRPLQRRHPLPAAAEGGGPEVSIGSARQ